MGLLMELDQNITYERNILKEKEISFDLERDKSLKEIEDIDNQIDTLKKDFTENLLTKKKVFFLF